MVSEVFFMNALLFDMLQHARQLNITLYLVGGSVRDALLKNSFSDLDFVVDDNLDAFGNQLKDKYDVKISNLNTLNFKVDSYNVDIAMFRSEIYTGHSGLPELTSGTFEEDLWRRDFTINTAYIKLDERMIERITSGTLEVSCIYKAHPQFELDLRNKTLRILNAQSFLQDPTRLLRAVKYMTILDFSFEKETECLFFEAINGNVIQHCALGRYKNILYKYTQLSTYKSVLEKLYAYDLLRGNPAPRFFCDFGEDVIEAFPEANHSIFIMLAMYANNIDFTLGIDRSLTDRVNEIKVYKKADKVDVTSDYLWHKLLKNYRVETLMYLIYSEHTSAWEKDRINHYYTHLKDIKVLLTGKDLLELGIPSGEIMGQLKEALLAYKVDSGLPMTKLDEINWIVRKYDAY